MQPITALHMSQIPRIVNFTEKEEQVIDALVATGSYERAAERLRMQVGSLRAIMFRIRRRYDRAKTFVDECERKQRMLPRKKRYVTG